MIKMKQLAVAAVFACMASYTQAAVSFNIDFYSIFGDQSGQSSLNANDVEIASGVTVDIDLVGFQVSPEEPATLVSSAEGIGVDTGGAHNRINGNRGLYVTFSDLQGTSDSLLELLGILTGSSASSSSNLKTDNVAEISREGLGNTVQIDGSDSSNAHAVSGLDPVDPYYSGLDTWLFTGVTGGGGYELRGLSGVTAVPEPAHTAALIALGLLGIMVYRRKRA